MSNTTSLISTRALTDAGLSLDEFTDDAFAPGDDHSAISQHESGHIFIFFFGCLFLGCIFKQINKKTSIPYTPMLFFAGILLGYYHIGLGIFGESIYAIGNVDPHGLLLIFLPALIFEAGFNADHHVFKRHSVQIFILAIPCVMLSAIYIAFFIKVVLGYTDAYYTWLTACMFGAILSCTDTTATRTLMKEARASEKIYSLTEGESLFNSSTCMVLLTIGSQWITSVIVEGTSMATSTVILRFLELTIGGVVLGIIFGILFAILNRTIFNDEKLAVNISLVACYLVYYVAENVNLGIQVSGMFALATFGLFMARYGKTGINTETEQPAHTFWKYAVHFAETIIFPMAGVIIGIKVLLGEKEPDALPITEDDLFKLFGLYLCIIVCRFLAIGVFMPILRRQGYGLTWKEVH